MQSQINEQKGEVLKAITRIIITLAIRRICRADPDQLKQLKWILDKFNAKTGKWKEVKLIISERGEDNERRPL
jgi:hypothetical protein